MTIKLKAFWKGETREVLLVDWLNELVDLSEGHIEIPFQEIDLMQYTGIDCQESGEEIYSGYILRYWEEDQPIYDRDSGGGIIGLDIYGGFSQIGVVRFNEGIFEYVTMNHEIGREEDIDMPLAFLEPSRYEILGNIYEHPLLLESDSNV